MTESANKLLPCGVKLEDSPSLKLLLNNSLYQTIHWGLLVNLIYYHEQLITRLPCYGVAQLRNSYQ